MNFEEDLKSEIAVIQQKGLLRRLRGLEGFQGARIVFDGRKVLNFCSNNYLGLADDSRIANAALDCMKTTGFGSGASRLVCGNMDAHRQLEKAIAEFKGTEDAILFSSGYMANVGIISSLFKRGDVIFSDRLNHASIIDGIQLSGAKLIRYPHCDVSSLEALLKKHDDFKKRCIVTDSVFSMDGDLAPLPELVDLAKKYQCVLMVDEAHALGVFGEKGSGLAEHYGLGSQIDVQMGTLSKAAGCFGAYCCGSKLLIQVLVNKARSFIYTTSMPPSNAAAAKKAVEIISYEKHLRAQLWDNTRYFLAQLKVVGFDIGKCQSPVVPIIVKDAELALEFSQKLFQNGILATAIRPPTVPQHTARLRLTVMATHTKQELDFTINQLQKIGHELCLI